MLAELLLREEEDFDEEQDYILSEIIRYFDTRAPALAATRPCAPSGLT